MEKKSLLKILLPILAIVGVIVGSLFLLRNQLSNPANDGTQPSIEIGGQLQDFKLLPFGANEEKNFSSLGSKVYLVNFWATWCEACMVEMPSIVKLYEAYKGKGFDVIGINVDDNPEIVLPKALKQLGITFPVYIDRD